MNQPVSGSRVNFECGRPGSQYSRHCVGCIWRWVYFLRSVRPEPARDHDIRGRFTLVAFIPHLQGWRGLGPTLHLSAASWQEQQSLRVEYSAVRSVATEQAKPNTPALSIWRFPDQRPQLAEAELGWQTLEPLEWVQRPQQIWELEKLLVVGSMNTERTKFQLELSSDLGPQNETPPRSSKLGSSWTVSKADSERHGR